MFVDVMQDTLGYMGPAGTYFIGMLALTLILAVINCAGCCPPPSGQGNCFSPGGCCECCACCCPCCVEEVVGGRDGPADLLGSSAHGVR